MKRAWFMMDSRNWISKQSLHSEAEKKFGANVVTNSTKTETERGIILPANLLVSPTDLLELTKSANIRGQTIFFLKRF